MAHLAHKVEIQVELEELEEQLEAEEQNGVFDLDPFDTVLGQEGEEDSDSDGEGDDDDGDNLSDLSSDAGGDLDDEEDQEDVATDFKHIQGMVNKLDAILKVMFDHFNKTHATTDPFAPLTGTPSSRPGSPLLTPASDVPRSLSPTSTEEGKAIRRAQFHTLLAIFDRTILRTFKSRYTQFVIFWYSSLDPEFADLFQGMLVSKALLEEDQPPVTRAAAASYIASFVSRAQFVDRASARRVVAVLCLFLRSQLDAFDAAAQLGAGHGAHVAQHSVFYAVAQAVFLIFCFRWRDLLEDLEGAEGAEEPDEFAGPTRGPSDKWMPELDIVKRVVTSELNPLKVCPHIILSVPPILYHSLSLTSPLLDMLRKRRDAVRACCTRHWLRILLLDPGCESPFRLCPLVRRRKHRSARAGTFQGATACAGAFDGVRIEHILPLRPVQTPALGRVHPGRLSRVGVGRD